MVVSCGLCMPLSRGARDCCRFWLVLCMISGAPGADGERPFCTPSTRSRSHPVTLTNSSRERRDNRVGQEALSVRESSIKALQVLFLRRSAAHVPGAWFGSPHRAGLSFLLTYVRVPSCR